ncbi:MAG: S9 family peptidase [Euryarchaeota archaeon]|nr:S9 family peptidase [Euryarchaeota archaeon]
MKPPKQTRRSRSGPRDRRRTRRSARPKPRPRSSVPLTLERLFSLPQYKLPALSRDRGTLAFYFDKTGRNELYVLPLDRLRPRQVSHGEAPRALRSGLLWDREGTSLFFGKDIQGNENHDIYRIWTKDGRVERLTEDPSSEKHPIDVSPDGRWLLLMGNLQGKSGRKQLNLWRLRLEKGSLPEQLTDHANPAGAYSERVYSPDGKWIAYGTNELEDPKNEDVYRIPSDGGTPELLLRVKEGSKDVPMGWSPDGASLAVASDATGSFRPGLLEVGTHQVRWFGHAGWEENPADHSPDGRRLLTVGNSGVATRAWVYDLASGKEEALDLPGGTLGMAQFLPSGSEVLLYETDVHRPWQFWAFDLPRKRRRLLLAPVMKGIDPRALAPCETVHYPTFDGREIEALVYHPRGRASARRSPALVEVHGGPTWQFFRQFNPLAQYLVALGFTLIEPNVRGSTGYGVEFRDMNRKDWGGGDLRDVVAATEYLRTLPQVDPDRVGLFGGSYGGYMTYLASVKRPEMWKAACAIVGITDLEQMWEGSKEHFRYFLRENMGDPVQDRELWRDRSALHFAEKLRAKLLMLHGANDPRCPVDQARKFRDRLLELGRTEGREFEYVEFGDEGHGSDDIQQKLRMWGRMGEFFQREL